MSHVNETWSSYVPPPHLSLAGKRGCQITGGVGGGGGGEYGRCIKKAMKKCHEINIISALTRPKNSFKNAMNVGFFFLSSSTIWLDYY